MNIVIGSETKESTTEETILGIIEVILPNQAIMSRKTDIKGKVQDATTIEDSIIELLTEATREVGQEIGLLKEIGQSDQGIDHSEIRIEEGQDHQ